MEFGADWVILWRGLERGLLYAPLAIYIGLLYRHLKRVDVSIDASMILSGVVSAKIILATGSIPLAVLAGTAVGLTVAFGVGFFELILGIDFILGGIVASLIIHAACVIWIGESMSLIGAANLFYGSGALASPILIALVLALAVKFLSDRAMNSEVGLVARAVRSSASLNVRTSPDWTILILLATLGSFVGLSGALNVQYEAVARSGGGFGRVIDALASFMLAERVLHGIRTLGERWAQTSNAPSGPRDSAISARQIRAEHLRRKASRLGLWLGERPVTSIAIAGSIIYHTALFGIQMYSPWPDLPRLIVGVFLLLLLCRSPRWRALLSRRPAASGRRTVPGTLERSLIPAPSSQETIAPVLEVRDLHKRFYRRSTPIQVLRGVNQVLSTGRTILITGYNGVGKTTLLRLLAGEIEPSAGSVLMGGEDITHLPRHLRGFFFLTQHAHDCVGADLTVAENLAVAQLVQPSLLRRGANLSRLAKARDMLASLGLEQAFDGQTDGRGLFKLSGALSSGQAQCLVFTMAALSNAKAILADEPTSGLDPRNSDRVFKVMEALARDRLLILVSHDARARGLVHRHFTMADGVLVDSSNASRAEERSGDDPRIPATGDG